MKYILSKGYLKKFALYFFKEMAKKGYTKSDALAFFKAYNYKYPNLFDLVKFANTKQITK